MRTEPTPNAPNGLVAGPARTEVGAAASLLEEKLRLALETVGGYLYLGEAWALHEAARHLPASIQTPMIVEIGSWKGRSTIALAMGVSARGSGRVFAIDPHRGSRDLIEKHGPIDSYAEFEENIRRANVSEIITALRTTSHLGRTQFGDNSVHLLFIDGSHEYEDVLQDINDWIPALANRAHVIFNDPSFPGVYRALRRTVLRDRQHFKRPRLIQNSLFLEFERTNRASRAEASVGRRLAVVLWLRYQAARFRPYMPQRLVRVGHRISGRMVGAPPDL